MAFRFLIKELFLLTIISLSLFAQEKPKWIFVSLIEGAKKIEGFAPLCWDEKYGWMLMRLAAN